MENTYLFMGFYKNSDQIQISEDDYVNYNIPLAYMFIAFVYFFVSLIALISRFEASCQFCQARAWGGRGVKHFFLHINLILKVFYLACSYFLPFCKIPISFWDMRLPNPRKLNRFIMDQSKNAKKDYFIKHLSSLQFFSNLSETLSV